MNKKIILASGSPRRKTLLEWAEVSFDVIVQPTDESYPSELAIEEVPVHIARQKALAVAGSLSGNEIVIAADTVVVLGNEIIGKPTSKASAGARCARLCCSLPVSSSSKTGAPWHVLRLLHMIMTGMSATASDM